MRDELIDLTKESVLTAVQACRHPLMRRGERPLNRSVLERWMTIGLRVDGDRVRLESFKSGGLRMTTREAIERFFARLNGAPDSQPTRDFQKEHERAEADLAGAGI